MSDERREFPGNPYVDQPWFDCEIKLQGARSLEALVLGVENVNELETRLQDRLWIAVWDTSEGVTTLLSTQHIISIRPTVYYRLKEQFDGH